MYTDRVAVMKKIIIIVAVILVGIGLFLFFTQGNNFGATMPDITATSSWVSIARQRVQEKIQQIIGGGQDLISGAVQNVKEQTFQSVRDAVTDKVDDFGKSIGVGPGAGDTHPIVVNGDNVISQQRVFFTIKIGAPAYFTIKNHSADSIATYEINWQDGKTDSGTIEKGKIVTVSHSWQKAGEYNVDFKIKNATTENYGIVLSVF